jgi:hypothetical protein
LTQLYTRESIYDGEIIYDLVPILIISLFSSSCSIADIHIHTREDCGALRLPLKTLCKLVTAINEVMKDAFRYKERSLS